MLAGWRQGARLSSAIGVLGGTFAPIHNGHLRLATTARDQLGLAEVRLVPAGQPPLRGAPAVPAARRLRWVKLALRNERQLIADDRELKRSGPSYTVDTLAELRAERPRTPLCLLVGQDQAAQLTRWHRWRELFALAHLIFFNRPGAPDEFPEDLARELEPRAAHSPTQLRQQLAGLVWRCDMPPADISSSAIRARLKGGQSVQGLVPDAVIKDLTQADLEAFAADETVTAR